MTKSPAKPRPVQVGRYRYSKLRWRLLVHALDLLGTIVVAIVRRFRPARPVDSPRRILVVQLDHLGDAVLSTPLIAELRAAYPEAAIDVLASPSNHEVFEADPHVDRVWVAERTWFERRPDRWALATAVWSLGRSLRSMGYDLGIDVRGDVLTVMVLALAGVRRRVGWSMGGGAFLLTDVAGWIPGAARGPLAAGPADPVGDRSGRVGAGRRPRQRRRPGRRRPTAGGSLAPPKRRLAGLEVHARTRRGRHADDRRRRPASSDARVRSPTRRTGCTPIAFRHCPPSLAVHLGAGNAAKRWPAESWKVLIGASSPTDGGSSSSGGSRTCRSRRLDPARPPPRLDRDADGHPDHRPAGAGRPLHRGGLRTGSPGGLRRHALGHPVQRDQPTPAVAALVATFAHHPPPRPLPAVPPEGLPARRPPLHVGPGPRPGLPQRPALVVPNSPGGVAPRTPLTVLRLGPQFEGMLNGTETYKTQSGSRPRGLAWLDRAGMGAVLGMDLRPHGNPGQGRRRCSPGFGN